MYIDEANFNYERAHKRAFELGVDYDAVFIDVIWEKDIDGLADALKDKRFVVATTQTNVLMMVHKLQGKGFRVVRSVEIPDGVVKIYGVEMCA